ncbi:hypothetical protein GDO81_025582 [Engystomops pustulosus]|uniref:Olfactory receptor n=1 Tax=Engystomops pustulosus TaxID=76066 RepID=A0AAV6YW58_ENGPU|nr:hypothetical protein GDO81_028666 [Engystomops pustulosus]KAG8541584.1 hypothetical protein GDO81_028663 [Engystomops pustulosus]KAG8543020.1 hypothetical protein GDO81_025582 [Engystomops pustulosus]
MTNQTIILDVFLVGFLGIPDYMHNLVSTVMFLVYMVTLTPNGSVIFTLPNLIAKHWFSSSTINLKVCLFQMFCVHSLGSLDSFLLMVMAIDRYIVISQPLRYTLFITNQRIVITCTMTWLFAAVLNTIITIQTSEVVLYCPSAKKINTLFCAQAAVVALYRDSTFTRKVAYVSAMMVLLLTLGIILLSYTLILVEISISSRSENRQKAFYTCATHLLVVALYYVPRFFVYTVTNFPVPLLIIINPDINVLLLSLFSFVPHMANPIIYFLRTKEISQTLAKSLQKIKYRLGHISIC